MDSRIVLIEVEEISSDDGKREVLLLMQCLKLRECLLKLTIHTAQYNPVIGAVRRLHVIEHLPNNEVDLHFRRHGLRRETEILGGGGEVVERGVQSNKPVWLVMLMV